MASSLICYGPYFEWPQYKGPQLDGYRKVCPKAVLTSEVFIRDPVIEDALGVGMGGGGCER